MNNTTELETQIATARANLRESERAADRLADLPSAGDVQAARDAMTDANEELQDAETELADLRQRVADGEEAQRKSQAAEKATEQADTAHAEVQAADALAAAFAPDGIPGDLLAEALDPINGRLANHAASTGWATVRIGADMTITANGRDYRLLSESEQWRADAMIAEALSFTSGLRMLVLDRLDVLDLPSRSVALNWLRYLAESEQQDTIIVMATLKKSPEGLGDDVAVHWLDGSRHTAAAAA